MAKRDYRQITKDPIIDLIRGEAQNEGFLKKTATKVADEGQKRSIASLANEAGISGSTIRNWFFGETKRPQSFSTRMVLEALGVRTTYIRRDGTEIRKKGF